MSERRQEGGGLVGEHGTTSIADRVVSEIAGISAQEVEGVHMGGGASRSAGGVLGSVTGSQSTSRGVSVEVGTTETAIDLSMAVEYGRDILGTVESVRSSITERVEYMTGLKVMELNVTINDVIFPENGDKKRSDSGGRDTQASVESGPPTRTLPRSELRPGASERESTSVEPTSRTHSESQSGPVPDEPVRAEGEPVGQDETVEIQPGDVGQRRRSSSGSSSSGGSSSGSSSSDRPSSRRPSSGSSSSDRPSTERSSSEDDTRASRRARRERPEERDR